MSHRPCLACPQFRSPVYFNLSHLGYVDTLHWLEIPLLSNGKRPIFEFDGIRGVESEKILLGLMRTITIPNFFVIGAPKAGTTSLCEYLKGHPQIFFSSVKEPHFFDTDMSKSFKLSRTTYLSLFSGAKPDVHQAVGEGSTGYLFSTVAVSNILQFNTEAKFIVMLRNPLELAPAWHSEMFFEGIEEVSDFEEAWNLEPERRMGRKIPVNCVEPKKLLYSEWAKLGDQMERLYVAAPRSKVKVVLFEDLLADTKAAYNDVLSFLGVLPDGRDHFEVHNENKIPKNPTLQRRLAGFINQFRRVRSLTGLKLNLGSGLSDTLLRFNSYSTSRKPVSKAMQGKMAEFFREDVVKLGKLLDRDLSPWLSCPENVP